MESQGCNEVSPVDSDDVRVREDNLRKQCYRSNGLRTVKETLE